MHAMVVFVLHVDLKVLNTWVQILMNLKLILPETIWFVPNSKKRHYLAPRKYLNRHMSEVMSQD